MVIAGKAGGKLVTGRNLSFSGQQHAKLLVSIGQLMGLSSLTSVGDRSMNSGPLSGLWIAPLFTIRHISSRLPLFCEPRLRYVRVGQPPIPRLRRPKRTRGARRASV